MKNLLTLLCILSFTGVFQNVSAQNIATGSDENPADYLERSPIYDYSEIRLNNTDTIPDFTTKKEKLMITGTIFQNDGKTPAKDVILYISQPDENGDYQMKTSHDKRYVQHRAWIKTDADGHYTFYTFIPGNDRRVNQMQHIHAAVKEIGKPEEDIDAFLFDSDPMMSKHCRKRLAKKGIESILKPVEKDGLLVATRDIVLEGELSAIN